MSSKHNFFLKEQYLLIKNNKLSEKSKQRILKAKSNNTIKAYQSDWKDFCNWCEYNNLKPYPAEVETVVNYINDLADNAKANTIVRRISALSENFDAGGLIENNPCKSPLVKNAIGGIKKTFGTKQKSKEAIIFDDLKEMINYIPKTPELLYLRDKAILLIGFMGAFRRSEISNINFENLNFTKLGLIISVVKSKADQEGLGETVSIPYVRQRNFCAVKTLENWLELANINNGPIFRAFTKNYSIRKNKLSDKSIALIVKKYIKAIGLNPDNFGAHSLRHGFATTAAQNNVEERHIMRQTRHKSVKMVRRYINEVEQFKNNPINKIIK